MRVAMRASYSARCALTSSNPPNSVTVPVLGSLRLSISTAVRLFADAAITTPPLITEMCWIIWRQIDLFAESPAPSPSSAWY